MISLGLERGDPRLYHLYHVQKKKVSWWNKGCFGSKFGIMPKIQYQSKEIIDQLGNIIGSRTSETGFFLQFKIMAIHIPPNIIWNIIWNLGRHFQIFKQKLS